MDELVFVLKIFFTCFTITKCESDIKLVGASVYKSHPIQIFNEMEDTKQNTNIAIFIMILFGSLFGFLLPNWRKELV